MGLLDTLFNKVGSTSSIKRISAEEAKNNLARDKRIVLLDVRESYEYNSGHIKGAKNLSVEMIDQGIAKAVKDKETTLYVYCQSGTRSTRACQVLSKMGYTNIYNLGGISSWPYEVVRHNT